MVSRREMVRWMAGVGAGAVVGRGLVWGAEMRVPGDPVPVGDFGFETNAVKGVGVAEGVTVVQGPGGNITVIRGGDGAVVVDSGVPMRGADVVEAVKGAAGGVPRTLINTHWHFDHSGGNEALVKAGVGAVVAHEKTLERMSSVQHNAFFGMDFPASPEEARPTVTFGDRAVVRVGGGQVLEVAHVPPAHTDGDVVVRVGKGDVVVTGDLFSNGLYPFIDYSSGGSIAGMIGAAEKLLGMVGKKTVVVPGHGAVATRGDLVAFREMLVGVREKLAALAGKGMTVEEAVAARPLAEFDGTWGKRFFHSSHFVRLVYPEMMGTRKR